MPEPCHEGIELWVEPACQPPSPASVMFWEAAQGTLPAHPPEAERQIMGELSN